MPVQLSRLAAYFGFGPAGSSSQQAQPAEEQGGALLEYFPVAPMPKIMSAEDYLKQKMDQTNG